MVSTAADLSGRFVRHPSLRLRTVPESNAGAIPPTDDLSDFIESDTVRKVRQAWERAFGSVDERGSSIDPHSLFDWGL